MRLTAVLPALLAGAVHAHFFVTKPPQDGFNEDTSTKAPCGGYDINNHTTMTYWPVSGGILSLTSLDDTLDATVNFAMYDNTSMLMPAFRFTMKGAGDACLTHVPVPAAFQKMVGMEAVMQVVGKTDDGTLFSCAFLELAPPPNATTAAAPLPAGCKNSTGVTIAVSKLTTTGTKRDLEFIA